MADCPSPHQLPGSSPSNDCDTPPDKVGRGYFNMHSDAQAERIKKIVRHIGRGLGKTDQEPGYVYVAKQGDSRFCKVGFAKKDAEQRIKAITKCQIATDSSYRIGSFVGAHRAEQLVHGLLSPYRHIREDCPCGCRNREWYQHDYEGVKCQVQIVYAWMRSEPYEMTTDEKKLKPVWEEALERWQTTQKTQAPLGWNDFFIMGPSMNVVITGLCYDSSPQTNHIVINLIPSSGMKKMLKRGIKRAKLHLTHHVRGGASVSPASKIPPPHLDEQSNPGISGDWEAAEEESDPTPSKPPQSRLLRTWNHRSTARDTPTAEIAVSGSSAPSQKITRIDPTNKSPSDSFPNRPYSTRHAASTDQYQQTPSLPKIQRENNNSPVRAHNHTGGATYYLQATAGLSDICIPSGEEEGPNQRQKFWSTGDQDIIGNIDMWARMPGAFPEDEVEKASVAELDHDEVPELLSRFEEFAITQNIHEEEQLIQGDSNALGVPPVDKNLVISISDNILPVTDQLVSVAASLVSKQLPSIPIPLSTPTTDGTLSTRDRSQLRTRQTNISPFEACWYGDGNTTLLPVGLTRDAATRGKVTEAYKPNVAAESAHSEIDQDSYVITDFKATGPASSYPSGGLGPGVTPGVHFIVPSEGTTVTPFAPTAEKDTPFSRQIGAYQSICFMQPYQKYSFEELRLADYNAGHRFAVEDDVEYDTDTSDWETQSSLSDNDRPWTKQRELARELWNLRDENNEYTYGLNLEKLEYEFSQYRLERLRRDLQAMDIQSTERPRLPTWDDWLDEPLEDEPGDESWYATSTEEEDNDKGMKQDESSAEEDEVSVTREHSPPKSQHKRDLASALHLNIAAPASTPFAAQSMLTGFPRLSTFKFNSGALKIDQPEFNPTLSLGSSAIPPPAKEALVSTTKIFSDAVIDPALKVTRRNSKAVSAVRLVSKEGLRSYHDSNHSEGMLATEGDSGGRAQAPIEDQKRPENTIATALQPTKKMNQSKVRSHSQQKSPSVDNTIARRTDGRPALAIKNEAHQDDVGENSKNPASESLEANRHIPSPSCAWGVDGKLGLDRMSKEPFRESDFLLQNWSFGVS